MKQHIHCEMLTCKHNKSAGCYKEGIVILKALGTGHYGMSKYLRCESYKEDE